MHFSFNGTSLFLKLKLTKDKTIKIQAQKGWGFSNYAAINLGFTSFEELSKMKHKEKMKLYNNLPADQRKSLEYEVDRIWKDNKNEKGFSKTNKHYIASNAGLIVTSLDEGVYNQYAFIKFDIGKLVEIAQVAEQPQKLEEKMIVVLSELEHLRKELQRLNHENLSLKIEKETSGRKLQDLVSLLDSVHPVDSQITGVNVTVGNPLVIQEQ